MRDDLSPRDVEEAPEHHPEPRTDESAVATAESGARMAMRDLRLHRGLGLRQVEATTGINRGELSRIERGITWPTFPQLELLACAYGVDVLSWEPRIIFEALVEA